MPVDALLERRLLALVCGHRMKRLLRQSLSAGDANDDGRNILRIDESIEVFRASKIGKMNNVVRDLRDLASHLLSGSQVQLDTFTGAACKKAHNCRVRL